jgi:hypothetical protein
MGPLLPRRYPQAPKGAPLYLAPPLPPEPEGAPSLGPPHPLVGGRYPPPPPIKGEGFIYHITQF